ncbi:MAG: glycosyltransferase family 2 protein [Sedimentisphaerales bacterium]|nr:glycosyltransferase family 2 protein [Sedimentisphaerales bacterium]
MIGLILALVANVTGLLSFVAAGLHHYYIKRWHRRRRFVDRYPRVAVIAPHRGQIIPENVDALIAQDYPGPWEIIFVTTRDDRAYEPLRAYAERHPHVRLVIAHDVVQLAREQGIHRGQKNENLIMALSAISVETEVIAGIDSDVYPTRDWLRALVEPFADADSKLGAATFAVFYEPGTSLASCTQAAWVLGSAGFLIGPWGYVRGGSFSIHRRVLETTDLLERWKGEKGPIFSDDINLSVALRGGGYRTCYVPGARAVCKKPRRRETWSNVLRFTNRQLLHVWSARKDLWLIVLLTHGFKSLALIGALCVAWWHPAGLLALTVPLIDIFSFLVSLRSLRRFDPSNEQLYESLRRIIPRGAPLAPILATINTLLVCFTTQMRWGGVAYTRRTVVGYTGDDSWRTNKRAEPTTAQNLI